MVAVDSGKHGSHSATLLFGTVLRMNVSYWTVWGDIKEQGVDSPCWRLHAESQATVSLNVAYVEPYCRFFRLSYF